MRNEKRYEDIDEILAAGIDVISTVNIQHLESLNDAVFELTGVRVRETFPDRILDEADEVVLVDLTPEALQERLRAGKVYPPERAEAALAELLPRSTTSRALRELALRELAEDVEARRAAAVLDPLSQQAVAERVLALVDAGAAVAADPAPRLALGAAARRRDRRALGAQAGPAADRGGGGRSSPRCAGSPSMLGAHFLEVEGDDLVATVRRVVDERGSTYVFVGTPDERRRREILRGSLVSRLVRELPGSRHPRRRRPRRREEPAR